MKRKLIFCTFILSAMLLTGCGMGSAQGAENTPSTTTPQGTEQSQAQQTAQPQSDATNDTQNNDNGATMISEDEAKKIALTHAGLTVDQVTFIKSGIDRDDGKINYDVEFYSNEPKEYDYEIDPYTGDVLDYDYDADVF